MWDAARGGVSFLLVLNLSGLFPLLCCNGVHCRYGWNLYGGNPDSGARHRPAPIL